MQVTRIVTHTDFDGLASALLMQEVLGVEAVAFADPQEIEDGTFTVHRTDAVLDLPYPAGGCALWVDHHASNNGPQGPHVIFDPASRSCTALIGSRWPDRLERYRQLIAAADMIDSASYSEQDIRSPTPAMQVAFSLEHGGARYREFLIDQLRTRSITDVAGMAIVQEKCSRTLREHEEFLARAEERIVVRGNVLLLDGIGTSVPHGLLPFMLYLRYPHVAVSLIVSDACEGRAQVWAGENIFFRINAVDLGMLMRQYGGGGHKAAAGCSIPLAQKEDIIERMVVELNASR